MTESTKGLIAMFVACTIWGLSPLFWALVKHVPATEVIAYRTLWSMVFFLGVLTAQKRLPLLKTALTTRKSALTLLVAGLLVAVNWGTFISAIQLGFAVEASLGYFIFPLIAVVLGRVVLGEALQSAQWLAVALATTAVCILTAGLGVPPWIALILGGTFGLYGLIKKQLDLGPVVSVAAEVVLLAPIAILFLTLQGSALTPADHGILALSGPMTAIPLMLFSYAARRARLSTVGLVQYVNPTLQFLVAVFIFAEPFTTWHAIAFPVIWVALAIYSLSSLRATSRARRGVTPT